MFEVRSNSPMDDEWLKREEAIKTAAGCRSSHSGAGVGENACAGRDHGWYVKTIDEAVAMKERLMQVPLVTATIREK